MSFGRKLAKIRNDPNGYQNETEMSLQPILAIIGHPVDRDPSQYVLHQAFMVGNMDWRYITLDVAPENLADAIRGMRAMGFAGGNIANPHKESVVALLDAVTPVVAEVGTVNVFCREGEGLTGDNSEGKAVVTAILEQTDPQGKEVVLVGAGRVGRAIAFELACLSNPPSLIVYDQEAGRAEALRALYAAKCAAACHVHDCTEPLTLPREAEILIQATSGGDERPNTPVPLDVDLLPKNALVVDLTLRPDPTWLTVRAKERGCTVIDGLGILVAQEAINYRLWTGQEPRRDIMREAAEEFLEF